MSNPILVEITRGALVESVHRGAIAVLDALVPMSPAERRRLADRLSPPILNRRNAVVGAVRVVAGLFESLCEGTPIEPFSAR